jgi:hypothetical protein
MKKNYVKPQMAIENIELETMMITTSSTPADPGLGGNAKDRFLMQEEIDELSRDFGDLW